MADLSNIFSVHCTAFGELVVTNGKSCRSFTLDRDIITIWGLSLIAIVYQAEDLHLSL